MKGYLVLFLNTVLLLFALPKSSSSMRSAETITQGEFRKSCKLNKRALKRTCTKKCIKHQSHSEQQPGANVVTDCGQQVYATLAASDNSISGSNFVEQTRVVLVTRTHLSPELANDPDPPRLP